MSHLQDSPVLVGIIAGAGATLRVERAQHATRVAVVLLRIVLGTGRARTGRGVDCPRS